MVLSICPPHAAGAIAAAVAAHGFAGTYVDANAVSPASAAAIAVEVEAAGAAYVDGGIVGSPPGAGSEPASVESGLDSGPTLFLSGAATEDVAALFADTTVRARPLAGDPFAASAAKVAYAAWTKGSAALLLTVAEAARRSGVEAALAPEWEALPGFGERLAAARADAAERGWRWSGEMEEIARALADLGLPAGFHEAATEVFREA